MKVAQRIWSPNNGWEDILPKNFPETPQVVFVFGSRIFIEEPTFFVNIRTQYPESHLLLCSTAGEITGQHVTDNTVAFTAIYFEKSTLQCAQSDIHDASESLSVGEKLADQLPKDHLVHVLVFSEGLHINGTELIQGLNNKLPSNVTVTGALVADGNEFKKTVVGLDEVAKEGKIVVVGLYGEHLKVGFGSFGGWDTFGIERIITKSQGNVVFELDNKPALALYKNYLGDQAKNLPSSGLLFPLHLKTDGTPDSEVVRTILGVDEKDQSLTFAGDMPTGARVSLMKANFERLIDGAAKAGSLSLERLEGNRVDFALLISCVGRKLVLKERVEDEVTAVGEIFGQQTAITGFYSYGELCPTGSTDKHCRLHNQTMTITIFREE